MVAATSTRRRSSTRTRTSDARRAVHPQRVRLRDVARHVCVPQGIRTTAWPTVRSKCRQLGLGFDDWQDSVGKLALAKRADGTYAAGIGGVVLSIPRQTGKTFLIAAIVFAMCLLHKDLTVLWTAHRKKTAEETFGKLQAFARRKKIAPHVDRVTVGSGDEVVYFKNGSRILFGARERGFGRGFDDVDVEIFDEAQILTEAAVEDMVPATNVAKNPLLFFIGTPPRPKDPGEVFRGKRKDALDGDEDTLYVEFSADPDANEDDREQWAKANPSYPSRTNTAAVLRMKKNMNTPGSFRREALGIWDDDANRSKIHPRRWAKGNVNAPPAQGVDSYGVKFSPDGAVVALSACRKADDGRLHVECIARRPTSDGTAWLVEWLAPRRRKAAQIVIDGKAGQAGLVDELRTARVPKAVIITPTTDQVIAAHTMLLEGIKRGTITHLDDPVLADAVARSGERKIGKAGGWGFEGINGGDPTALESAVFAVWAARTSKRQPGRKTRGSVLA
jgi:hypothetical protein